MNISLDGDTLSLILAAGGLLVGGFALWFSLLGLGGYKARLRNEEATRYDAAKALTAPGALNAYLQTLEVSLDTLTRWMGRRVDLRFWGLGRGDWRGSFGWCVSLALIYPIIFLVITWLIGGTTIVGAIEILPQREDLPFLRRLHLAVLLLGEGIVFYLLLRHIDAIDGYVRTSVEGWLRRYFWQRFPKSLQKSSKVIFGLFIGGLAIAMLYFADYRPFFEAIFIATVVALAGGWAGAGLVFGALVGALVIVVVSAGVLAVAIAVAVEAVAIAGAGAGALALTIAIVGSRAGVRAGAGALAKALAVAVAGPGARAGARARFVAVTLTLALILALAMAVLGGSAGDVKSSSFGVTILLFFLLLPFVNAMFDWASWQVSRWLGDNLLTISRETGYPRWKRGVHYVKDIVIDGGFALACLIGLAWAIPRIVDAFNSFVPWLSSESILNITDYLCAAATEPLGDGLWATSMLFSTLLPTVVHFLFLLFAPLLWWLSPSEANRARAAHLTHGTRPPAVDLRGKSASDKATWSSPMPTTYGAQALHEDQAVFQGPLNETTLHAITIQLRFLRPLYYAVGLAIVGVLLYWLGGLFISSWRPVPEILLWIAHNFDYTPVRQCFPEALPTAPFETLAI